jgi:DNA end-binding protein Ku
MEDGSYVVFREDELAGLRPKAARTIETLRFVPTSALSAAWLVRPYYLAPDGDEEAYFALAAALQEQKVVGLVRWVMRNIEYVGALTTEGGYLVLITLRHAEEMIDASKIPAPSGPALGERESRMAVQLIEAFQGEFAAKDYRDDYRERVLAFVDAKSRGKSPKLVRPVTKTPDRSLLNALEKSLKRVKKERHVA